MRHRHLTTDQWTLDAIDSALERGDLSDWRDLFGAAKKDRVLASRIHWVATQHDMGGASILARHLCKVYWPTLTDRP